MKKLRLGLLAGICVLGVIHVPAQYYFYDDRYYANSIVLEIGAAAGIMNCLTDLGGRKGIGKGFIKDLNWKVTKPCIGIYAVATYKEALGLRLQVTAGNIASYDSLLKKTDPDLQGRYGRNLSFRSRIAEFQLAAEVHPLLFSTKDEPLPLLSPYFIAGIGYFSFNPQAKLGGQWHELHPLRLEGQGFPEYPDHKPYELRQLNVPLGTGIRYEIGPTLSARFEIVYRLLFTDYLDDVSTTYIDPSVFEQYLSAEQAIIARRLHSRMNELQPGYQVNPSIQRGDTNDDDTYFTMQVKMGWVIRKRIKR